MEEDTYSLRELADETGYTTFTIRHYVRRGLLPPADRFGSFGRYGPDHVARLNAMTRLREDGASARVVALRLQRMSLDEIRAVAIGALPAPPPPPVVLAPPPVAPPPPRSEASLRNAVDALVCVAAEALDASPRVLRPALAAVFARMDAEEITAAEAVRVIASARTSASSS